jgi:hypothetical protein
VLHTQCYTPSVTHPVLHTQCYTPSVTHPVLHTQCYTPSVTHPVSHTQCRTPSVTHPVSHTQCRTPSVTHPVLHTQCHTHTCVLANVVPACCNGGCVGAVCCGRVRVSGAQGPGRVFRHHSWAGRGAAANGRPAGGERRTAGAGAGAASCPGDLAARTGVAGLQLPCPVPRPRTQPSSVCLKNRDSIAMEVARWR